MDKTVPPGRVKGTLTPPCSKSYAQRALAAALLSEEVSVLRNIEFCDDTRSALQCIETLGARVRRVDPTSLSIEGGLSPKGCVLNVGESGLSTRLFTPVASLCPTPVTIEGRGSLLRRPMQMMFEPLRRLGVRVRDNGGFLPIEVCGPIQGGEAEVDGSVSSQFITGLLLALPLLDGESRLRAESPIQSRPYIDMTLDSMKRHGVSVTQGKNEFIIAPQRYLGCDRAVESDWSHAALWLAARELGNDISILGMTEKSVQGDRIFMEYLRALHSNRDIALDVSQCPDIVPPLALAAALRSGRCDITHAARLRYKECDRLDAVSCVLNALGADIVQLEDGLIIRGVPKLRGGAAVDCRNDHRIAMMAAAAAAVCSDPVIILGAECVGKSYPDFWKVFRELGGAASAV